MMDEVEYEPAPRQGGWKIPVIVGALALVALFAAQRYYRFDPPEPIQPVTRGAETAPEELADGSAPAPVPEPVDGRFGQPVVMSRVVDVVPRDARRRCTRAYFAGAEQGSAEHRHHRRLQRLVDETRLVGARVGPDALGMLRIGRAPSPPGYPRAYQVSCLAEPAQQGWRPGRPHLGFARNNVAGASGPGRGDRTTSVLLRMPEATRWVLEERPGWWLGHEVSGRFFQLVLPAGRPGDRPVRMVFLDEDGSTVEDRTVERPGSRRPGVRGQRVQQQLRVGRVDRVLTRLGRRPFRACSRNRRLCVWVTISDTNLYALASFGPHRLDVPPFGYTGYCPGSRTLQGSISGSRFTLDGSWVEGPAPGGLVTYPIRYQRDGVVIDLSRPQSGSPRSDAATASGPTCAFRGEPVGRAG